MADCYKEAFATRRLANKAARKGFLRTYQCPHCNQWHITGTAFNPNRHKKGKIR